MPEETKTTPHGENYTVLLAPDNAEITTSTFDSHGDLDGEHEYHTLYVKCEDLRVTPLPLDSNPRLPDSYTSGDKDVVSAMRRTLANNPADFVKYNNGITLVCSSVSVDGSTATIEFGEDEGVLNGGHTYFAIQSMGRAIDESAMVRLEAIQLNPEIAADSYRKSQEILNIARHRNKNRSLEAHTQANYEGKYDSFKDYLRQKRDGNVISNWADRVNWAEGHQSRKGALKAKDFVRMLTALDPMWFDHPLVPGDVHSQACVGDPHSIWIPKAHDSSDQRNLAHMAPLSRAVIYLQDYIRWDLLEGKYTRAGGFGGFRKTNFYEWAATKSKKKSLIRTNDDGEYNVWISSSKPIFTTWVIGMLRSTVWFGEDENDEIIGIGFVSNPVEIYDISRQKLYKEAEEHFRETFNGKDGRRLVGSVIHHKHYAGMMMDMMDLKDDTYHFPEIFYSFETGSWYRKPTKDDKTPSGVVMLSFDEETETYELNEEDPDSEGPNTYIPYPGPF